MVSEALKQDIEVGKGDQARSIAVLARGGGGPGLLWLGGFRSDMTGNKALALDAFAAETGLAATRFDYSGHGQSGGAFEDGTISRWLEEALAVFEQATEGPQILIGSSMGGWISLLLAREHLRRQPAARRIIGLVLIAPAADFTEKLMWETFPEAVKTTLMETGRFALPSPPGMTPAFLTRGLIEDGRKHLLLDQPLQLGCPVHILQGKLDDAVPWQHAERLVERLAFDDVMLTYVNDGDHRLSRPQDLDLLIRVVGDMIGDR